MTTPAEQAARAANAPELWDAIWSDPAQAEWRAEALGPVYCRVAHLIQIGSHVLDAGGGVGTLASKLVEERDCTVDVWDISKLAAHYAAGTIGVRGFQVDLCDPGTWNQSQSADPEVIVATEVLEHLPQSARANLFRVTAAAGSGLFSVPNNRLTPAEEPQHATSWTAKQFLDELRRWFADCRVEVLGPFLLGVCGKLASKPFTLSVCTPARDEAADLELTLASFRGVADQLVVGVDYRTKDETREIAARYADLVFDIEDPKGPPDDEAPKVHMAHVRNRCLERCTGDWIFMTEAHESLAKGADALLGLDQLSEGAKVAFVMRTGSGQRWAFPWLHRRDTQIRYKRATHNVLDFPTSYLCVRLPQIETSHKRHPETIQRRKEQRRVQNRVTLTQDWVQDRNENSLLYLGSEWSEHDKGKAIERLREFLAVNRSSGAQRYHARLQCAKLLAQEGDAAEARMVLMGAAADDWSRVDHWFYLGDLALEAERFEEALQFYRYVSTRIGDPPFCVWWLDDAIYGYLCAQRMVECLAATGKLADALHWAQRALELLPDDSPAEALDEARQNIEKLTEAIGHAAQATAEG